MTDLPLPTLAFAAVVVTLAYTVYGLTGFGAALVGLPVLAHLFPLRFAVPLVLVFDLCAGVLLGLKNRQHVDRRELLRLAPFILVGMAVGVTLLVRAPERWLLLALGLFVLAYSLWSLFGKAATSPVSTRWAVPAGVVGGGFTALYGTGGPIYTLYLARRIADKTALRATIAMLIFAAGLLRLALFTGTGLYEQTGLLRLALVLLPFALLGYFIGSRLHARLPGRRAVQAVWVVLIAGGASLVWRAASLPTQ